MVGMTLILEVRSPNAVSELEHMALPGRKSDSTVVVVSKLWTQHLNEAYGPTGMDPKFAAVVKHIARMLGQNFSHASGFATQVESFQKRIEIGEIRSTRRAEMELIQAGKVSPRYHAIT